MKEIPPIGPTSKDREFVAEVNFIEENRREPDFIEQEELLPENVAGRLAQDLDLHTHSAANILTLLRLLEKTGTQFDRKKVDAILDKFRSDGEHADALNKMKFDLLEIEHYLNEQVGSERYSEEVLPQTRLLEQRLKANSEFIRTAGESGEPLDGPESA